MAINLLVLALLSAIPLAHAQQTGLNGTTTASISEITSPTSAGSSSLSRVPTITDSSLAPGQPPSTEIITDSGSVVLSTTYSTVPFGNGTTTGPSTVTTQPVRTSSDASGTSNPNLQSGASGYLLAEQGLWKLVLAPAGIVIGGMLVLR